MISYLLKVFIKIAIITIEIDCFPRCPTTYFLDSILCIVTQLVKYKRRGATSLRNQMDGGKGEGGGEGGGGGGELVENVAKIDIHD